MNPAIKISGGILRAFPAIHYHAVFAQAVNTCCTNEDTRPGAIAVELGPHMVNTIAVWMRELGVGKGDNIMLPCMLGVLVKNRLIHPDFRDSAFFLEEHFGKPLSEISSTIKLNMLRFSESYLVALSSTDSIIEAIRCAIELDIPVFGVDLDEFSIGNDGHMLIEEPSDSSFELEKYIGRNAVNAGKLRDEYIDFRRETVMASRLKKILSEHKSVLYTCGLAHWDSIKSLLFDPAVKPADFLTPWLAPEMTRVIIHPSISLRFMDAYPVLNTYYEESRLKQSRLENQAMQLPEHFPVYREIIERTYKKYFSETGSEITRISGGTEQIPGFESLLSNFRLMLQRNVPPMAAMFEASVSIMPPAFSSELASILMDINREWASPAHFPGLPVLCPAKLSTDDFCQLVETRPVKDNPDKTSHDRKVPFSVMYSGSNCSPGQFTKFWTWADDPREKSQNAYYNSWVWPPCESLLYGSAHEAARVAVTRSNEPYPSVFEGTLYQGIDIKATMRSIIQGEERIYIRKPSSSKKIYVPDGKSPDPTVFIFTLPEEGNGSHWSVLIGGSMIGDHVKNKKRFEAVRQAKGSTFIASIAFCHYVDVPEKLAQHVEGIRMLEGITVFGNPCINAKQGAQWVEDNDFCCCPVSRSSSINNLVGEYSMTHGVEISLVEWQNALIQFAIPYAKERVVIIAPMKFRIHGSLLNAAKRRNIDLSLVPLNYFPADRIEEMRKRIFIRSNDPDGLNFPAEVEQLLGQNPKKHMELLPVYMQEQLIKH